MLTRSDFSYFHGIVMQVTVREKVNTTTSSGGGFVYRGSGFIAPPSVSVHTTTIQEFWLKNPEREQHFEIYGNLPMREGQKVTALWLKKRLIAYVNHATDQFLLFKGDVNRLIGKSPNPTFLYALIPFLIFFALTAVVSAQIKDSIGHPLRESFWHTLFPFLVAALFVVPTISLCIGLVKNRRYGKRQSAITSLIEAELNSLLSRHPSH
jgi:hypothetical protein